MNSLFWPILRGHPATLPALSAVHQAGPGAVAVSWSTKFCDQLVSRPARACVAAMLAAEHASGLPGARHCGACCTTDPGIVSSRARATDLTPSGSGALVLRSTYDFDGVWENRAAGLEEPALYHARLRHLIFVHRPGGRVDPTRLEERDP